MPGGEFFQHLSWESYVVCLVRFRTAQLEKSKYGGPWGYHTNQPLSLMHTHDYHTFLRLVMEETKMQLRWKKTYPHTAECV